jgi:quinol-cytochrome oxidoreductase complex cytochrome b subunit
MKALNKIKGWITSFETIKTLNYGNVWVTPILAILSTMSFLTVTSLNKIDTLTIITTLLVTINFILLSLNKDDKSSTSKLTNFYKEHFNVICTMIVVTTFQMLSVWTYGEPKMMIPQSVQGMILIALPMFKWCVFIYVLTLSRVANEKRSNIKNQTQGVR